MVAENKMSQTQTDLYSTLCFKGVQIQCNTKRKCAYIIANYFSGVCQQVHQSGNTCESKQKQKMLLLKQ